jgi:hypothetical protein
MLRGQIHAYHRAIDQPVWTLLLRTSVKVYTLAIGQINTTPTIRPATLVLLSIVLIILTIAPLVPGHKPSGTTMPLAALI